MIQKGYLDLTTDRVNQYIVDYENQYAPRLFKESEFVALRVVGASNLFTCFLIYYINDEKLLVIKKSNGNDSQCEYLMEREYMNYINYSHPFMPKFYGIGEEGNYIVIEFIYGTTLKNINKLNLTHDEKINIIFNLYHVFVHFHFYELIYRDLKPDNIIVDVNKNVVLIDFDRLIPYNSESNDNINTTDSSEYFAAPEVSSDRLFSFKSDVYSFGKMNSFILDEKKRIFTNHFQMYCKKTWKSSRY